MQLVVVAPILNQIEAEILKGRLESDGIAAFIGSSNLASLRSSYANRVEGLTVSVLEKDYEAAKAIVAETLPGQAATAEENQPDIIAISDRVNWELGRFLQSPKNRRRAVLAILLAAVAAWLLLRLTGII